MATKPRVVLPYLIPQLTAPPINTKALAILASVAGDALTKYLHKILPALLKVVASPEGECVSFDLGGIAKVIIMLFFFTSRILMFLN